MEQIQFQCRNCEQIWYLPPQVRPKTFVGRQDQPKEILRATFWCYLCRTLSDYSFEELPLGIPPKQVQERGQHATSLLCISFRCGQKSCEFPIAIHIAWDAGITPDEMKQIFLSLAPSKSCRDEHPPMLLSEQPQPTFVSGELVFS